MDVEPALDFLTSTNSQNSESHVDSDSKMTPKQLPEEYSDFAEVFSEAEANKLPPHRGDLDHSIPLEEGSTPAFGPNKNSTSNEIFNSFPRGWTTRPPPAIVLYESYSANISKVKTHDTSVNTGLAADAIPLLWSEQ